MLIETFSRFKYAEEHAKRLWDDGHDFMMYSGPTKVYNDCDDPDDEECDEIYHVPQFVVLDAGPRQE